MMPDSGYCFYTYKVLKDSVLLFYLCIITEKNSILSCGIKKNIVPLHTILAYIA